MKYVELHHHSTYSYMDGHGRPAAHAALCAEYGQSAVVLTDHGNVSGHVELEKAALKSGIKPIFGLEAYTAPDDSTTKKCHLTVLASTQGGYANLNRLVTASWQDFYQYPTVYGETLAEYQDGLIVLSGCSDSLLACFLFGGKMIDAADASWDRAKRLAGAMKELLGDRFYLECQLFPELSRSVAINTTYEELSKRLKIPLVATGDVHTLREGDHEIRALLHAAGRGSNTIAQQLSSWEYEVPDYVPRSDREVFERALRSGLSAKAAKEACANTAEIAERCNVTLPKAQRFRYPVADPLETLWEWLRAGWTYRVRQGNRRMVERKGEYMEQLNREIELIKAKDFTSYFLLVSDLIVWAKEHGIIVGPGRGSSAASIVCYLLRITEPDPLQFPLTDFSRFIDPTREDLPDIDIDFDDTRRHEVREYAVSKFGEANVGNIGTFTKYKGKNSLQDVARVFSIPKYKAEIVANLVVERSGGDSRADAGLADTVKMFPAAAAVFEEYPDLNKALKLEGNYRGASVHAAGIVISDHPIAEVCAMYTRDDKKTGEQLTSVAVNKYDAEYLGLMKIDLLGLSTMGMLSDALKLCGLTIEDLYALPLDDPETLEAFRVNDVVGIFQFEGRATRLVGRDLKPDNFLELVDVNALSRPGPLFSGTTAEYINVKHGKQEPKKIHPIIDRIAAGTRGQIIYQEQILHSLAEFGGLPVKRVHEIRRIISQKLGEAQFNTSAKDFAANAARLHGVTEELAMEVWGRVVTSASYAFVYSHSLVYTIIGYWCMWMKVHHPAAFYAAQLGKVKKEKWPRLIRDAKRHGVEVRGVTPGLSKKTWSVQRYGALDGDIVVAGWLQLDGVAEVTAGRIEEIDAQDPIRMASDLLRVPGIGPGKLEKFRPQMESDDPFGLEKTREALDEVRDLIRRRRLILPVPNTNSDGILDIAGGNRIVWLGRVKLIEMKDVFEDERARTGDTLDEIRARIKRPDLPTSAVLHCYDDGEEDVYVRVTRFDYPRFKEGLQDIELDSDVIHVIARKSNGGFGASIYVKDLFVIGMEDDSEEDDEISD